jgi:sulfur relay protein TusB/DsrH
MILLLLNKFDIEFLFIIKGFVGLEEVNIIMIQDAVYLGLEESEQTESIRKTIVDGTKFYALENDVKRRGIQKHLIKEIDLINIDSFVDLLFQEDQRVINF